MFWTSAPLFDPLLNLPVEPEESGPQVRRLLSLPSKALLANPVKMRALFRSLVRREIDGVEVTYYGQPIARLYRPRPRESYDVLINFRHQAYRVSTAAKVIARSGADRGLIYGRGWSLELRPILQSDCRVRQVFE
jgi:hypothetical protein